MSLAVGKLWDCNSTGGMSRNRWNHFKNWLIIKNILYFALPSVVKGLNVKKWWLTFLFGTVGNCDAKRRNSREQKRKSSLCIFRRCGAVGGWPLFQTKSFQTKPESYWMAQLNIQLWVGDLWDLVLRSILELCLREHWRHQRNTSR